MSKEDEQEMCVHCGRHPTAFQEVQALREEVETLRELDEMHHGCPDFMELRERVAALREALRPDQTEWDDIEVHYEVDEDWGPVSVMLPLSGSKAEREAQVVAIHKVLET